MKKTLRFVASLFVKSLWISGLASLILTANSFWLQPVHASTPVQQSTKDVIQPFELTKPAATREDAYDSVTELIKNPKKLVAAEEKEVKAEVKVFEAEEKAAQSAIEK